MFHILMLSLSLCLTDVKTSPQEDYPYGLPDPHFHVEEGKAGLKFWISLEPKCVVETCYNESGELVTEITILNPERTKNSDVINFVYDLEGLTEGSPPMEFLGTDEDSCKMVTQTKSGHLILWECNPETKRIVRVTIMYQPIKSLES